MYDKLGTERLDGLAESASQWILNLFVKVTESNQAVVEHDSNDDAPKEPLYCLPNVHGESKVVADMLPLAYGSDAPPSPALYCDFCRDEEAFHKDCNHGAEMLVADYLPCGHSLHKCGKCRHPNGNSAADRAQCGWCFGYVAFYLRANCESAESSMAEISRPEDLADEFEEDAAIDNDDDGDEPEAGDDDESGGGNGSGVNSSVGGKKRVRSTFAAASTDRETRSRTQASQPEALAAVRAAAEAAFAAAEIAQAEEVARAERDQFNALSIDELRLILRNRLSARGADRVGRPPKVRRVGRR